MLRLLSALVLASPFGGPVGRARVFRLEFAGHVSYLFATNHVVQSPVATALIDDILPRVCQVLLESTGEPDRVDPARFIEGPGYLSRALSRRGLDVYEELLRERGGLLVPLSLKPGAAIELVNERVAELLAREVSAGDGWESTMAEPLVRWARVLDPSLERLDAARATAVLTEGRGLDHVIEARARGADLPLRALDAPDTLTRARLAFTSLGDLERALRVAERTVAPAHRAAAAFNQRLARMIYVVLMERYFEVPADQIGRAVDELLPFLAPIDAGQTRFRSANVNRHGEWMPEVMRALRRGPTLIAVGAAHVAPDFNRQTRAPLLRRLRAQGVKVTPLGP